MELAQETSRKVQIIRGLAILAVVLIHNTPTADIGNGLGSYQIYIRPFLNFAVGAFLFLSGFLSNVRTWKPFKRIKKVGIPYLVWSLIYVAISNYKSPINIPLDYFKAIITGSSAGMMYYVFVYCELTLLIPLIDKIAHSRFKYLALLISPLEILIVRLIPILFNIEMNKLLTIIQSISCVGWFSFFYLGYLLGNEIVHINISTKKTIVVYLFSLILQFLEGYYYYNMNVFNCGTQLKISSVVSTFLFCLLSYRFIISKDKYNLKLLVLLGDYSFGIFFSHLAVMIVTKYLPSFPFSLFPFNGIIAIFASCICVYVGKKMLGKYSFVFAL